MSAAGVGARQSQGASAGRVAVRVLLVAALAGAAWLALTLSRQRAFQVDEVEHVHVTFSVVDGRTIYRDFWEGHNPLLYVLLAPWVDVDDPVGSFRRARAVPFAVLLATAAVCAFVAYRLAGEAAAWLAGGLVATHSTMVERGLEVRPDGLLGLAAVGAFALEISRLPPRWRALGSALVLGLAFLATQKAAFLCLAFGALWTWRAWRSRSLRSLIEPALVGAAPFALFVAWLVRHDALAAYWRVNVGDAAQRLARRAPVGGEFSPAVFLAHEGRFNLFFCALAAGAIGWAAYRLARRELAGVELGVAALAALQFLSLWLNPFPFPYLHVTVVPALALLVAGAWRGVAVRFAWSGAREVAAVALILALCASTSLPRLVSRLASGLERQMSVLREVQRITAPDDAVFDLAGLYFRRDAYPVWVMTGVMMARYYHGGFPPMVPELERTAPAVIQLNYRTRGLRGEERRFLATHYVHHDGPIFVHGAALERLAPGEEVVFRALRTMRFRWEGEPALLVDGAPFVEGDLAAGEHRLSSARELGPGRLVPARATRLAPPQPPFDLYPNFD